jgi:hypothetical protein
MVNGTKHKAKPKRYWRVVVRGKTDTFLTAALNGSPKLPAHLGLKHQYFGSCKDVLQ